MSSTTRMRLFVVLLVVSTAAACNKMPAPFEVADRSPRSDIDAPFDPPEMYPGWAYDNEHYMKPAEPLAPEPRVKDGDPLHYFTNKKLVMVRQPGGYTPEEVPRVAIWWTDNNGFHWHKAGYFGRQQSFFPFEVEEDGDYGIRFVGPGQEPAINTPAYPERVYHVDTHLPEVEVAIEPEKSWYYVGETITISWRAEDYHLIEYPASIRMLMDFTADEPKVIELQRDLDDEGSITYVIPPEALDHEIRFRVDAPDRAGNLGIVHSYALQVVEEFPEEGEMEDVTADAGEWPEETVVQASELVGMAPDTNELDREEAVANVGDIVVTNEADDTPEWGMPRTQAGDTADTDEAADVDNSMLYFESEETESEPMKDTTEPAVDVEGRPGDDLVDAEPAIFPFIGETARPPSDDGQLRWEGPTMPVFPDGQTSDKQRAASGQIDVNAAVPADVPSNDTLSRTVGAKPADQENPEPYDEVVSPEARRGPDEVLVYPPIEHEIENVGTTAAREKLDALFHGALSVVDPTRGNGLLVPLPATVEEKTPVEGLATAHPWRILGDVLNSPLQTVWVLPQARFSYGLGRMFEGRYLADHPSLRPVAEPGAVNQAIAGVQPDAESAILP